MLIYAISNKDEAVASQSIGIAIKSGLMLVFMLFFTAYSIPGLASIDPYLFFMYCFSPIYMKIQRDSPMNIVIHWKNG